MRGRKERRVPVELEHGAAEDSGWVDEVVLKYYCWRESFRAAADANLSGLRVNFWFLQVRTASRCNARRGRCC